MGSLRRCLGRVLGGRASRPDLDVIVELRARVSGALAALSGRSWGLFCGLFGLSWAARGLQRISTQESKSAVEIRWEDLGSSRGAAGKFGVLRRCPGPVLRERGSCPDFDVIVEIRVSFGRSALGASQAVSCACPGRPGVLPGFRRYCRNPGRVVARSPLASSECLGACQAASWVCLGRPEVSPGFGRHCRNPGTSFGGSCRAVGAFLGSLLRSLRLVLGV